MFGMNGLWQHKCHLFWILCSSVIQSIQCQHSTFSDCPGNMLFHIKKSETGGAPPPHLSLSLPLHAWLSPVEETTKPVWQSVRGCLFWLMRSRRWHTKPLFSIMLLWVPTRSASLPVCRLALSTLARLSTWGARPPPLLSLSLSPSHSWYHSLSQPIEPSSTLSWLM